MSDKIGNNSIYTEDELEILNLTKKVRVDIVENMTKNGVPERSSDIRVLNEVAGSLDKLISDSANTRVKHQDSANNKAAAELVIAALRDRGNRKTTPVERDIVLDDSVDVEVVPGQMDINPDKLSPGDFITIEDEWGYELWYLR